MNFLAEVLAEHPVLLGMGFPGVVIGWFMFEHRRSMEKLGGKIEKQTEVITAELKIFAHKFEGLNRSLLIAEMNRGGAGAHVAKRMLEEAEARDKVAGRGY